MKKIILLLMVVLPILSMGQRKTNVLYVVDGIIVDSIDVINLNPRNIATINVLRDKSFPPGFDPQFNKIILVVTIPEYEATILAPGFDSFLATQQPKEFYSETNLKSKNTLMVAEWNYRCNQPLHYAPEIYEVKIDYEPDIDYGLEVEYKLYMFLKFMEEQHKMSLVN